MKAKRLITTCLALLVGVLVYAQDSPLMNMAVSAQLHTTQVSKEMLEFAKGTKIGSVDIDNLKGKLDFIEVYTNHTTGKDNITSAGLAAIASSSIKKAGLTLAINHMVDETINVSFYIRKSQEDENIIEDIVMIHFDPTERDDYLSGKCTVVRIIGQFTMNDFKQMIK